MQTALVLSIVVWRMSGGTTTVIRTKTFERIMLYDQGAVSCGALMELEEREREIVCFRMQAFSLRIILSLVDLEDDGADD
jgi:hypothetical protein